MNIKRYIFISILPVLIFFCMFLIFEKNSSINTLNTVKLNTNNSNNKMFAMYIGSGDTYEEYNGNTFPKGYKINTTKSKCIDIDGQEVTNALSQENEKIKVTSNKTVYCYIYLDMIGKQCTYDGDLTQGATFIDGPYTYKYKQQGAGPTIWGDMENDGWGIMLTDKESTAPVNREICTTINGKPVVSSSYMFYQSKATSIDVSSFNTLNVNNMSYMFDDTSATKITGYENFDTSNVTNMADMFYGTKISIIDVSKYDTSKVTTMARLFEYATATQIIGYENFDLSSINSIFSMFASTKIESIDVSNYVKYSANITDMGYLFSKSTATSIIGYEDFNTQNVTRMAGMFEDTKIPIIDVSKYKTSQVTDMQGMFSYAQATQIIGYENFDTRSVTTMQNMFYKTNIPTIDISKYNTSNVKYMSSMFSGAKATTINLGNIDTRKVTSMGWMFSNTMVTTIDLSSFDTTNVTNMDYMFEGSIATTGYARTQADAARFNSSLGKPSGLNFKVK